jgi:hypothetical protein
MGPMRTVKLALVMWGGLQLSSCGLPDSLAPAGHGFISWSESMVRQSVIAKSLEPELRVCLQGSMNSSDLERVKLWAQKATLTWLRVGKIIDERVAGSMTFSCEKPHLTVRLRQGSGTSYASPSVTTIYLTRPYGTWTHEFGHALAGLSDTYSGRTAGVCVSGQPQSLMCWGAYGPRTNPAEWSTLWGDDVAGFQSNYRKLFGRDLTAPEWASSVDLEAAVNVTEPWPGYRASRDEGETRVLVDERLPTSEIDYSEDTESVDL